MIDQRRLEKVRTTTNKAKYICFFGIGALLEDCFNQLVLSIGKEPDFLCDNAKEKWAKYFFGKKCISPSELADNYNDAVVIITIKNYENIYVQLSNKGIRDIFVCCYDRSYHSICAIKDFIEKKTDTNVKERPLAISVEGKWTLVTGASRGVGHQIALEMARLGSNIIAHSRSISHVEEVVRVCRSFGVEAVPLAADLGNHLDVEDMLLDLESLSPQIDIVFNNAAISPPCPYGIWSVSHEDFLSSFTINTVASTRICYRLIPSMIERGFGRIVNVTSSIQKRPDVMAYACSKAALDKFVHDLSPTLQNTGVMISLADPGFVRTDMTGFDAPHAVESVIPGVLLGALINGDVNGFWFSAQDYAGMSIESAIQKVCFMFGLDI